MRVLLFAAVLLWPLDLAAQCSAQDYLSSKEPDWDCEAPMEGSIVPKLQFKYLSVGIEAGKPAPFTGVLLDQDRVLSLGLRIKALRRLLWLEMQNRQKLIEIEKKQTEDSLNAEISLMAYQKNVWQNKAIKIEEELKDAKKWWRSWAFGYAVGSAVTAIGVATAAIVLR